MNTPAQPRLYLEIFANLIRDGRVSHGAFRLWHALRDYTDHASKCFPGQRRLAADISCHPTSLKPWTDELIAAGWLKVEGGHGRRFDYTVLDGTGHPLRKAASVENKTAPESRNGGDAKNRNTTAPESSIEPHRKVETKVSSPLKSVHLSQEKISKPKIPADPGIPK
ncbi:MAG: helix-turn-helix domain-containing protein [Verrucomicrobiota bacterium]